MASKDKPQPQLQSQGSRASIVERCCKDKKYMQHPHTFQECITKPDKNYKMVVNQIYFDFGVWGEATLTDVDGT